MRDFKQGDRSSFQFLRHLQNLVGDRNFDGGLLRQAFLRIRPSLVQTVQATIINDNDFAFCCPCWQQTRGYATKNNFGRLLGAVSSL